MYIHHYRYTLIAMALVLLLSGCGGQAATPLAPTMQHNAGAQQGGDIDLPHIHGLGFSADGKRLLVAAHIGLRVYSDGAWQVPEIPPHDYMGYAATDNGFYSSGHPDPSSGLLNPIGLVKSLDEGKTITTLGFSGASDFHTMGVGYTNHAIYVFAPLPTGGLPGGMSYSLDDGKTWQQSALRGLTGQPIQVAVHPSDARIVGLATEGGMFLSADFGASFERVGEARSATAAAFNPQGTQLYFGSTALSAYDLESKSVAMLAAPAMAANDTIIAIAASPTQPKEIVFATLLRDVYRTTDGGQNWQPIVQGGKGV